MEERTLITRGEKSFHSQEPSKLKDLMLSICCCLSPSGLSCLCVVPELVFDTCCQLLCISSCVCPLSQPCINRPACSILFNSNRRSGFELTSSPPPCLFKEIRLHCWGRMSAWCVVSNTLYVTEDIFVNWNELVISVAPLWPSGG